MRLHRLEATAFGPFADTVVVDLDALSASGLFLLTGPTGAGKSSVLDAIAFALYGDVPGDRGTAKRLRCDQAAPGVGPSVTLEATLSGRRFRIERSPAWERPKKRGSGTTVQQASVCISERLDGDWQALSTRLDETGHLVTRLVGMNLTQFCQVAMLPQGRFQAFLRARSEDRHALLQQVFRTDRFDRVEKWLRDHRVERRRASERHEREVAELVNRSSEAAGVPVPEEWEATGLAAAADQDAPARWLAGLGEAAATATDLAADEVAAAVTGEERARAHLTDGRTTADLQQRHEEAHATLVRLDADAADHAARTREVDAARRAAVVAPVVALAERADRQVHEVRQQAAAAVRRTTALVGDEPTETALAAAVRTSTDQLARVRAALPRAGELDRVAVELDTTTERLAALGRRHAELAERIATLPAEIAAARESADTAARAAATTETLEAEVGRLRDRLAARRLLAGLEPRLGLARADLLAAREVVAAARERWLEVREARLEGMAAEIAGDLAAGCSCPVCGSADHPRPAVRAPGSPGAGAEKQARRRVDDAEIALQAVDEQVRGLEVRVALARDQAGGAGQQGGDGLDAQLTEAIAALDEARTGARRVEGLRARLAGLEDEQGSAAIATSQVAVEQAATRTSLTALTERRDHLAAEVAALLDGTGVATLRDLADTLAAQVARLEATSVAVSARRRAEDAAEESWRAAADAATGAGFDDLTASGAAMRDAALLDALVTRLETDERARARVEELLADPAVRAAAGSRTPDLAALVTGVDDAGERADRARQQHAAHAARLDRLTRLEAELTAALAAWLPVRRALDLAVRVAGLVDGTSPDNRLRMRLSAFVLAHRLSQVVAAANLRLSQMSDQRYSLERSGQRGAGESRGGLSLLVRDDWSGERRDPATLSGGETFVVSLALALGLADVITQEAGGADLDTLFVDEGFGSLDADTLDDVMDTLDALRDGGRVVGVVSHVAEMRDRIPTQLRVEKRRGGSTVQACQA